VVASFALVPLNIIFCPVLIVPNDALLDIVAVVHVSPSSNE